MTLQGPTWSCLSCQSFLFLVSGKQVLCFPHLLLGESWTLTNLLRKGGTAQSNEVKLLCALFPLSFLSVPVEIDKAGYFFPSWHSFLCLCTCGPAQKLPPRHGKLNSLSELWPATSWELRGFSGSHQGQFLLLCSKMGANLLADCTLSIISIKSAHSP